MSFIQNTDTMSSDKVVTVRAPGRINLIGEHTDYNEGLVLPAAIDKELVFVISSSGNDEIFLESTDLNDRCKSNTVLLHPAKEKMWPNYLLGVVDEMIKRQKPVRGFYCALGGDLPSGAGMSSSAALECGLAYGLNKLFDLNMARKEMAYIGQRAEHNYVGLKCGIMDQFASMFGKKGHALKLDCRTANFEYVPVNLKGHSLVLLDSGVKHSLAETEYNIRREHCESGVEIISQYYPDVKSLRDCNPEMLNSLHKALGDTVYRRCLYVVEENLRVEVACRCLANGDLPGLGRLMTLSHFGLSRMYEVSCWELDSLQEYALEQNGVLGARMMGGGFGGCTLNLVEEHKVDDFVENVRKKYFQACNLELTPHFISIADGVSSID